MKTVIVTGANSGLGLYTSKHLLLQDYAVVLACRNLKKATKAQKWLHRKTGKKHTQIAHLDLASFNHIRKFCLNTPLNNIYGVVCNAGIAYAHPTRFTQDGIEETFGVNHLGHFLLVNLLLGKAQNLQRIAVVSSDAHNPDIQGHHPPPYYQRELELAYPDDSRVKNWEKEGALRYANSKLCNVLFVYHLAEELKKTHRKHILVNAFNPGFIPGTGLGKNSSPVSKFLWFNVLPLFSRFSKAIRTANESGKALTSLISEAKASGKYYDGFKEKASSKQSYDKKQAQKLWWRSEELAHLKINEKIE
ncbi:SDR family NAD(P)-dependent oxidoreductase [uncultured Microscilla sp.]|uniref:SDR family NAD(P)-dependent oxidoreductase n=1 Tax=uncultured Microscilla sp. TaxID=432653 RepID=UPI0026255B1A|nr:SDR family NAD(P)-dependent oxidoreductase [uncultured Microscilla sp.]